MIRPMTIRVDGRIGWRISDSHGLALGRDVTVLAPLPGAARPLVSVAGDLGGHALPMRVAAGPGGSVFMIDALGAILRYDPCLERFEPFACLAGPQRPIGLTQPMALAVDPAGELLVLDGAARMVTAISLIDGHIKRQWGPFRASPSGLVAVTVVAGHDPLSGAPDGTLTLPTDVWDPVDLAVMADGCIVISDRIGETLHRFDRRGTWHGDWNGAGEDVPALAQPGALAAAGDGRLFVVEEGRQGIAILDRYGQITARTADSDLLPGLIDGAQLAVDADGTLWISNRQPGPACVVRCDCSGQVGCPEAVRLVPDNCAILAFDQAGNAILGKGPDPCLQRSVAVARQTEGSLGFAAFDSGVTGTIWDRVTLDVDIPAGTMLTIWAYASDAQLLAADVAALGSTQWTRTPISRGSNDEVAAIRAVPGRFLWLRIDFAGTGFETPELRALVVGWPRRSSAQYLPAAWSADPASADFLARFMALFDQLRSGMLAPIDAFPALFDPRATPAAKQHEHGEDFLDWLASWIGIVLDRNWPVERRRRLVAEAPKLFRIKGTLKGLARHIEIYTGIEPKIVEHFRLRRWLTLDEGRLDGQEKLWGAEIVRRLQLDGFAEVGRFTLVDGGDPLTDPIAAFAHRATVFVPVGSTFGDADLAALEDVVRAARPAHVTIDIRLIRPRFVIGCDLVLGVNTIIGRDVRVAQADHAVLGEDIRLAGPPSGFTLSRGLRLGQETTLE